MLSWKDTWPFGASSPLRCNRYYIKKSRDWDHVNPGEKVTELVKMLQFNFGLAHNTAEEATYLSQKIEEYLSSI